MKTTNLDREKQLAELYKVVLTMKNFADADMWGYSRERDLLLDKIYHMRMDCIQADIETEATKNEEFNNRLEQANLEWSSNPQRSIN